MRFGGGNTAANPTLNVNGTGSSAIQLNGAAPPPGSIGVGVVHGFVHDGTAWQLLNPRSHPHEASDITGRLQPGNLPSSAISNRVLAVGGSHTDPAFVQVGSAMIADNAVATAHIQDNSVTNAKITGSTISQAKMHIVDGFVELGLPSSTATLLDVINAIRALPLTRPVSLRFNITSAAIAERLRAPLTALNSVMQIERAQTNSNLLLLTYYSSINSQTAFRIFYASHFNTAATVGSINSLVWREIPLATNGRLALSQMPTRPTGWQNRVLAITEGGGDPSYTLVTNAMIAADAVGTLNIQNGSVTNPKLADLAIDNAKIANNTIRQAKLAAEDGFVELGLSSATATLVDVITAIRALPASRLVSVRLNITSSAIAGRLRAPLSATNSMMQVERAQHTSNMILLTYYTGLNTPNHLRIFYANHGNNTPSDGSVSSIIWREIAQHAAMGASALVNGAWEGHAVTGDTNDAAELTYSPLAFINALTPKQYHADNRCYHWGFLAQEVEKAAKDMGIDCPAVKYLAHNKDNDGVPEGDDTYTMAYTELIAPMVGAMQQLAGTVEKLQKEIATLKRAKKAV